MDETAKLVPTELGPSRDNVTLVPYRVWFPPGMAPKEPGTYSIYGEWQFDRSRGPEFLVDRIEVVSPEGSSQ